MPANESPKSDQKGLKERKEKLRLHSRTLRKSVYGLHTRGALYPFENYSHLSTAVI